MEARTAVFTARSALGEGARSAAGAGGSRDTGRIRLEQARASIPLSARPTAPNRPPGLEQVACRLMAFSGGDGAHQSNKGSATLGCVSAPVSALCGPSPRSALQPSRGCRHVGSMRRSAADPLCARCPKSRARVGVMQALLPQSPARLLPPHTPHTCRHLAHSVPPPRRLPLVIDQHAQSRGTPSPPPLAPRGHRLRRRTAPRGGSCLSSHTTAAVVSPREAAMPAAPRHRASPQQRRRSTPPDIRTGPLRRRDGGAPDDGVTAPPAHAPPAPTAGCAPCSACAAATEGGNARTGVESAR